MPMLDYEFNDEFEEDTSICTVCGAEDKLTGWNGKKQLSRFECAECGCEIVYDKKGKRTFLKGKERDWESYLKKNLRFPINATIDDYQDIDIKDEEESLQYGDKVIIQGIDSEDFEYGVMAKITAGNKTHLYPLSDLCADDRKSPNYKTLDNYRTWFANCR
jgi:Zn ribbon nucleic-acid-binding protein